MADIAKSGTPSLATALPCLAHQVGSNLLTAEAIAAFDACYIASTGLVTRSIGTAANAAAQVDGYAMEAADSGGPVTLYTDIDVRYGTGLTPGTKLFLGAAAGAIADAATTGGTAPIGKVIDATRVRLWSSKY